MRLDLLPLTIVCLPALAAVIIVFLWSARSAIDALKQGSPRAEKALRWLPPRGRVSRAFGWAGLFLTLMLLLAEPSLIESWDGGPTRPTVLFSFPSERWLVAVAVGVVAICAAVAAWVDSVGEITWAALLLMLSAALAILGARSPILAIAAGDVAALLFALMLAFGSPTTATAESDVDRGLTLRTLRRYLTTALFSSLAAWLGWALAPDARAWHWLLLAGLLIRCAAVPAHIAFLGASARLPLAGSMMLLGAIVPAGVALVGGLAGMSATFLALPLVLGAAWSWTAAPSERDLGRTAARWSVAAVNAALAVALAGLPRAAALLTVVAAVGSAAALYLVGSVERVAGHREIGRLRGLGARLPGVFGWIVVVVLAIAGGPPFASFTGRLLAGLPDPGLALALGALSALAIASGLSSVHRTFLGIPRHDEGEPVRLKGRERLVLTLLCACAAGSSLAPTSLWRTPLIPTPPASPPTTPPLTAPAASRPAPPPPPHPLRPKY